MQVDKKHCEKDAIAVIWVSVEKKDKDNKEAQEKAIAVGKEKIKSIIKLELHDKIRWYLDDEFGWLCSAGCPSHFGIGLHAYIKN